MSEQPTKESHFRQHFAKVLQDLQVNGSKDPETMAMIATLANDIARQFGQTRWTGAKEALSRENYDELLASFQKQGNALHKAGSKKQAYAIQTLATSLVAGTQRQDPVMAEGEALLDAVIDSAVAILADTVPTTH